VRGNVSESEMTSFLDNLTSVKISLTDDSEKYPFEAQYLRGYRTPGFDRETVIRMIGSKEELKNYFNSDSYAEKLAKYDEKWFATHKLMVVAVEESSGSITHKVTEITADRVVIERNSPDVMTCDWAVWDIVIELDKDAAISDNFSVEFTETRE
jgi:hypothetical protein